MTAMDSDSESQDSDDGRRFRFEATRKDSVAPVNTTDRSKSPKKKHKSSHSESYRDRRERPKHESGSKTDDKDLRYSAKHSKHELRNSRQEDNKNSHKDHRESRTGFATNENRGSRNSNGGDAKERSRDSKRQSDRDRSVHRMQRSREHSYERNHHDERASSDKHRGRYHEKHGHRSRDRSRDRSHQSSRVKSSNDDHRSREDYGRHDSSRKISVKENRLQNSRDYSSPKNTERERSHSETRSCENTKKDSSIEAQDCKDLDLSQFDVLSETDENMSDGRDSESRTSSPHSRKIKLKRHDSEIQSESRPKRENDDGASERKRREELKVKRRSYDPASGSSNNNPSAVSDSLLSSASYATLLVTRETLMDSEREKSEYRDEEEMLICDSNAERSSSREKYSCSNASSDETRLFERSTDQSGSTYGPLLPPGFAFNASDGDELDSETNIFDENKINDEVDGKNLIGPRLLPRLNDRRSMEREDAADTAASAEADAVFGPALPPHLLQRQRANDSRDRIIGPVLPNILELHEEHLTESPEADDYSAIGPLPVDHPALRTSRVHEQLDLRAQRIRNEKYSEEIDVGNKREEWMTELPPAQAANLGLGPRKFRLRDGPDMSDRSCWTDTPAQKAQKQMDSEAKRFRESEKKHINEVHSTHKRKADKSEKHEKSLLEMHQSKIAKKKKKEEKEARRAGISTRRPFDRDVDLQVNRFDQAQKKTILMKAQLLDDRFARGQI